MASSVITALAPLAMKGIQQLATNRQLQRNIVTGGRAVVNAIRSRRRAQGRRPGRQRQRRRRGNGNGNGNGNPRNRSATVSQPYTIGQVNARPSGARNKTETGTEDLFQLVSSADNNVYDVTAFSINPVEPGTFTRLNTIASGYQRFRFNWVLVNYVPFKGTTQTGELAIGFAADATRMSPVNMVEFQGLYGTLRGSVNLPVSLRIDPDLFNKVFNQYMIKTPLTPNPDDDSPLNSVGRLFIATQNVANETSKRLVLGRVTISYNITLEDPKISVGSGMFSSTHTSTGAVGLGDVDFDLLDPYTNDPVAVYPDPLDSTLLRKRYVCPVALWVIVGSSGGVTQADLQLDGATINPKVKIQYAAGDVYLYCWYLPVGRDAYSLVLDGTATSLRMHSFPCMHEFPELVTS